MQHSKMMTIASVMSTVVDGQVIGVELKDGRYIVGIVDMMDNHMNIFLHDCDVFYLQQRREHASTTIGDTMERIRKRTKTANSSSGEKKGEQQSTISSSSGFSNYLLILETRYDEEIRKKGEDENNSNSSRRNKEGEEQEREVYGDEYCELLFLLSKKIKFIHFPQKMNMEAMMKRKWNEDEIQRRRDVGMKRYKRQREKEKAQDEREEVRKRMMGDDDDPF